MSSTLRTLTLGLCALFLLTVGASVTLAHDEGHEEESRRIKIVACDGDEVTELSADDLALGETRDVETSCGKVVSITRTFEDELQLAVDGKEIRIPGHIEIGEDGVSVGHRKVIVRRHGGDCEDGEDCEARRRVRKVVIGGDGDEDIDVDVMALVSEHLDLDCEDGEEDCPSDLVRVLSGYEGDGDGEHVVVIKKRVRSGDDEEEDDEE